MSISAMKQAYAVPLIEQLESVPADARMMYEHDKSHHENIPVGRLCHEAATALRQAIAEAEKQEPWVKTYCGGKPNYTTPAEKQEPVAWREVAGKTTHYYDYNEDGRGEPLYAAPQPDLARVGEVGIWGEK